MLSDRANQRLWIQIANAARNPRRDSTMGGTARRTATRTLYLSLADMFICAIACVLILIIVAKRFVVEPQTKPQASVVIQCIEQRFRPGEDDRFRKLKIRRQLPAGIWSDEYDVEHLSKLVFSDWPGRQLTLRLLLHIEGSADQCVRSVKHQIKTLNKMFDSPQSNRQPPAYILLDIAHQPPSKS